jgi:hypothetical protein
VSGEIGTADPVQAAQNALRGREVDEIVLSTLLPGLSRWLGQDVPTRLTGSVQVPGPVQMFYFGRDAPNLIPRLSRRPRAGTITGARFSRRAVMPILRASGPPATDRSGCATALRELVDYWADGFDWSTQEARLNAVPNYRIEINELEIHFIHVPGRGPRPRPLLLHGYPSTPFGFLELISHLTGPAAHGGDPADAFGVVAHTFPGHRFPRVSPARLTAGSPTALRSGS